MNKILIIFSLILLAACGPSQEEKEKVAAVTCSIMGETRNMDAAVRVEKMNEVREKIGGEAFLRGDDAIKEAFEYDLCQELVLNEFYDETLQPLKDAKRERERIAAENRRIAAEQQRIADSKPSVKQKFHSNGKLYYRVNYGPKVDGEKRNGLAEEYYENGQLSSKGSNKDGGRDGLWEFYRENGTASDKLTYKNGQRDGREERYYENGQLDHEGSFKDGKKDGLWEYYHENGNLRWKVNYKNGDRVGREESYYENGKLKRTATFKVGKYGANFDGLMQHFDEGGVLKGKTCYKSGRDADMSYCEK
tara:strand:- start:200 stop:1117 length:918 start_codon:yes stop_codon:yes gene_type:complete